MCWLAGVERAGGLIDQFNQTLMLQAPVGVSEAVVVVMVQALLDRHAMLRLRVDDDGAGGWSLWVPEPGSVDARTCVQSVEVLSDDAVVAARSRLDPAAGVMLSALWAQASGQLVVIIHHLAVDAVSWRILVEDLNFAWAAYRGGQQIVLPISGTSFARWASLLVEHARRPHVVEQADAWKQLAWAGLALPMVDPAADTYATAGHLSEVLDTETTSMLLAEVPTAFHTGIHEILVIAFALAVREFLGTAAPIGIDVEGHGRDEELGEGVDLTHTVGWFTIKYPVALTVGGLSWAQVITGQAGLGALIKDAKEQLGALPDPLSYGVLRYLNPEVDLAGPDPGIGFNYLGRLGVSGAGAGGVSADVWRISQQALSVIGAAAVGVPMALAHTVELNAVTIDTDTGAYLHANWTWAPSALDHAQISRLSRLWFEALGGICAHVRAGGGGLTPSDIAPARLSQPQIDELHRQYRIADILPLTPLQQGLLFHASTTAGHDNDVYAVQLDIALSGALDRYRLRDAVHTVINRHPHLVARFSQQFDQPVQIIPQDPVPGWRYVELDGGTDSDDVDALITRVCAAERAAVCDLDNPPGFRTILIRLAADRHRCVFTFHHLVADGWSLPILLGEIFAGYHGQRLAAPAPYRRFVAWLAGQDLDAARAAWQQVLAGCDTPTLVGPPQRLRVGTREVTSFQVAEQTTRAVGELARSSHTTVNTVLQGAFAQLLCWLTGQHDVVFGTPVSGRPAEVAGADSMVGLLINTVPVRATLTAATTTTDLLSQLQDTYNDTLEHQHLALAEIHRITGQELLFDTLFVYENYPIDTTALTGAHELTLTEVTSRESTHYPLTLQAAPGTQLGLRLEYDTEVFDAVSIEALAERLQRVLVAMTADPGRRLSSIDVLTEAEHTRLDQISNRTVLTRPAPPAVAVPALFAAQLARIPEAVAIRCGTRSMTYRELEEAANRWAHFLVGQGAGPGEVVALLFARCAEAIVAMLAVLKTGAAYLPIDPGLPATRIGFMLADTAPITAITTADLHARLDDDHLPDHLPDHLHDLLIIDIDDPGVQNQPSTALPTPAPTDIAYLIYTSGTTGVPKGVAVTHHNITQLFDALQIGVCSPRPNRCGRSICRMRSTSRCSRSAGRCCWWAAGDHTRVGGRLTARFPRLTVAEQVSVLTQTPSAVGMLAAQGLDSTALVIGAEPCPAELVERWAPGRVMVNVYGATEATMWASNAPLVRGGCAADWFTGAGGGVVCVGWVVACGAGRGGGGVVCGWPRGRGGVLAAGGVDGVAVCGVSVRWVRSAGTTDVSDRGFGVLGC